MISTGPGILMISNEAGDPVNEDKVGATQLWHRLHSRPCVCVCASDRCSCCAQDSSVDVGPAMSGHELGQGAALEWLLRYL